MAWIPMYLLEKDVEFINDWLNREEEIAFIVSSGHKQWVAKKEHAILPDIGKQLGKQKRKHKIAAQEGNHQPDLLIPIPNFAEYHLWHIPSGPLPLLYEGVGPNGKIDNPWLGWTEIRTPVNPRIPFFGAGHPGVFQLEVNLPQDTEIRMSNFGWIGNHYKIIGKGAELSTEKFWDKLKRMVRKAATHIPRGNNPEVKKEVYAFPAAYQEIKNGRPSSSNSWQG